MSFPRKRSMTKKQLAALLDYMERHNELCTGTTTATFTKLMKRKRWLQLTKLLNSLEAESASSKEVKSMAKWKRTWIDWRHSVKKKAKEIRKQKERGFQTKTLSPLEVRALKLFRKLETGKFEIDSDLADLDLPEIEQDESIDSETTGIQPVKIEDVLCISENSNTSSYDDIPSGASISSPSPRPVESSSSVTSKSAGAGATKAAAKDNAPTSCVVNSVYVVSTKAVPSLAVKKASSSVVNATVVSHQEPPKTPLLTKIKQEVIEEIDISDKVAISESSTTHSPVKDKKKTSTKPITENSEDFESCIIPPKRRIEDTLGGLPLTLQNSILERLDTLNRNIETNTCALTILAKAVNDSAESNMRVINYLTTSLNKIGNMVGSYVELMKIKQQEK